MRRSGAAHFLWFTAQKLCPVPHSMVVGVAAGVLTALLGLGFIPSAFVGSLAGVLVYSRLEPLFAFCVAALLGFFTWLTWGLVQLSA